MRHKNDKSPAAPEPDFSELEKKVEKIMGTPPLQVSVASSAAAEPEPLPPPPVTKVPITEPEAEATEPPIVDPMPAVIIEDTDEKSEKPGPPPVESVEQPAITPAPEVEPATPATEGPVEPDALVEKAIQEPADDSKTEDILEDPLTDDAVDDIVANESDTILAVADTDSVAEKQPAKPATKPKKHDIGRVLRSAIFWWIIVLILLAGIGTAVAMPNVRYKVLNTAGVRSSTSLKVYDQSTLQPLKNVSVTVSGQTQKTDANGSVRLTHLKLGSATLVIHKAGFTDITDAKVIGWGSNPLGNFNLVPSGSQYTFAITDFLSGKPIANAEATSGDASALSGADGKLVLTFDPKQISDDSDIQVSLTADTYRTENIKLSAATKDTQLVKLVPARKHVFVSKRSGTYDVYKIDVDGKNEQVLLAGTGSERDDIVLAPHPTDDVVALVSTRENVHDKDGYLLSTLTLIDTNSGTPTQIAQSQRVQIVDWIGSRLLYVQIAAGASAASPGRYKLISYDYKTKANTQLATGNYFNDVVLAGGQIYYAPASAYQADNNIGFFRINPDGSGKIRIFPQEVWNILRTDHDTFSLAVQQDWYTYKIGENAVKKSDAPTLSLTRVYEESPSGNSSLWVDQRDGKGVLLFHDNASGNDKILHTQSGLKYPARWLNSKYITYRIVTDQETADYALNIDGGDPIKIKDVSNTGGVDRWYYY